MFNSLMSMIVSMLNDKRTAMAVVVFGLVAVFMMSAPTFSLAYAQQGITGKGEQNILQSEENKVKADASEGRHLILPGMGPVCQHHAGRCLYQDPD